MRNQTEVTEELLLAQALDVVNCFQDREKRGSKASAMRMKAAAKRLRRSCQLIYNDAQVQLYKDLLIRRGIIVEKPLEELSWFAPTLRDGAVCASVSILEALEQLEEYKIVWGFRPHTDPDAGGKLDTLLPRSVGGYCRISYVGGIEEHENLKVFPNDDGTVTLLDPRCRWRATQA